jgi:phage terminase large subunit GpA-like protein
MKPSERFPGIASGRVMIAAALAAALAVPPAMTVAMWADQERVVPAESGSPYPGKWRNALTPFGVEPMECLSPSHPCSDVVMMCSAQVIKSEVGVNFVGHTIDVDPSGMLIALPSIDEAHKFVKLKLQPAIDATPALRFKVKEAKSRDETGSTASFKRFRGGFVQITHTGSSKGLQGITVKKIWGDEISEYPHDVGNRGDPIDQMRQRASTFALLGAKALWTSTPKNKGTCRITALYEASDQRRYYWPCPHCGAFFVFRFEHLKWDSEKPPHGAHVIAPCCGCQIEHWQKREMLAKGVWLKTFPAADDTDVVPGDVVEADQVMAFRARLSQGRQPGFHLWRGQSPFADWNGIVAEWLAAKDSTAKLKTFTQQVLGEAFEEAGEAPDHLKLFARREERDSGKVPEGVLAITGWADVQRQPPRIEYAVYGWGLSLTAWLIEKDVILGDPYDEEVWAKFAEVTTRLYPDEWGRSWPIEAFGVDSGYASHAVYNFVRRRPNLYATDGRKGATHPLVGTPKKVDVNYHGRTVRAGAILWPIGGHPLKSALYAALQKTIDGPDKMTGLWPAGCIRFPMDCDEAFFQQITAEYLKTVETRDGFTRQEWQRRPGQANEQLDIWCGNRAMAYILGLDRYTPAKWAVRILAHAAPEQGGADDLFASAERVRGRDGEPTAPATEPRNQPSQVVRRRVVRSRYMEG